MQDLDDDTLRDLKLQLDKELCDITHQYSAYVRHVRETLNAKGVTVDDLNSNLLTVTAFAHKKQQRMFLSAHETELENAASVNKIIKLLVREYASFLNCEIFQFIVKTYRIAQGQDELKYPELLEAYLNRHRVSEFIKINPQLKSIASSSKELVLKVDMESTSRLARINDLKTSIAKILQLKTLRLLGISEGCVVVKFQIPAPVAECIFNEHTIFTEEQLLKQFQSLTVVRLECNGRSFSFADKVDTNVKVDTDASLSKELVFKIDMESTSRLAKIIDLKTSIAKILQLKSVTLQLVGISEGCVVITFQILSPVAECIFNERTIFTEKQFKQFQSLSAVKLECNGRSFSFAKKDDNDTSDVCTGPSET